MDSEKCKCGHLDDEHEAMMDADGYPHDFEQFCMGGADCDCAHYEPASFREGDHIEIPEMEVKSL